MESAQLAKIVSPGRKRGRPSEEDARVIIETRNVTIRYDDKPAIRDVSLVVQERRITAIIGPSGCGKNLVLRS